MNEAGAALTATGFYQFDYEGVIMDVQSITPRPCRNCGSTERNYRGDCIQCKRTKAVEYYRSKNPPKPFHLQLSSEEKAARKREYHRKYYENNKQRCKELGREWTVKNRDKSREIKRKWREANPEAMIIAVANWRKRNLERDAENKRRWNRDNADRKRVLTNNRRNRLVGKLSTNIVDILLERQNGLCACCAADLLLTGYHIDHIRPVSKGGLNIDSNVQLLTPSCNLRKNAKWPI